MEQPGLYTDSEALRLAMRRWATGVTIVASQHAGVRHGMTVSSFTSVSLEPPLVLVSLERTTRTHELIQRSGIFSVTILTSEQQQISDRFAGRESEMSDRFAGLEVYTLVTGAPLLQQGLAGFDCRVVNAHSTGTHTIFIGDVLASRVHANSSSRPLIYYNRGYRRLCDDGTQQ
ncbi:MAG: flavin reductase family protein [Chloroflexi bacterium]|nr:flavin reductase family protein [Chloroflexota bacterium]